MSETKGQTDAAAGTAASPAGGAEARPSRRTSSASSRRAAQGQKRPLTGVEKGLYAFIVVCVLGGAFNFIFMREAPKVEVPVVVPPPKLNKTDALWFEAGEIAAKAGKLTLVAREINATGDKSVATEKFQEASAEWDRVMDLINKLEAEGFNLEAYQKTITRWTQDQQECEKFQLVDDFDFEKEMKAIKEKNRLEEEQNQEQK